MPFLEADAKDICKWKYEGDYAVYNYPSWDECVNMQIAFTNEKIRREQYYKVLKAGERLGYFRLEKSDNVGAVLTKIAVSRGCLKAGGRLDIDKVNQLILRDFRTGRLGRFTLDDI